jgi:hypothetical protein
MKHVVQLAPSSSEIAEAAAAAVAAVAIVEE